MGSKILYVRVPDYLHGDIKKLAEEEGRTISGQVRYLIEIAMLNDSMRESMGRVVDAMRKDPALITGIVASLNIHDQIQRSTPGTSRKGTRG
jgi:hypothetical protein